MFIVVLTVLPRIEMVIQSSFITCFYPRRPHKDAEDLQEFTEPDCTDMEGVKPFFEGHDRFVCLLFYSYFNLVP